MIRTCLPLFLSLCCLAGAEEPAASVSHASFDGESSLETKGSAFDTTKNFTLWALVRTSDNGTIFAKTPAGDADWAPGGCVLFIEHGCVHFDVGWVGQIDADQRVDDGAWHEIALVYRRASGRATIYIDGKIAERQDLRIEESPSDFVVRVGYAAPDFPDVSAFKGQIADLRFYSRAMSSLDIRDLRERSSDDQLLASWSADDKGQLVDATGKHPLKARPGDSAAGVLGAGRHIEVEAAGDFDMTRKAFSIVAEIRTRNDGTIFSKSAQDGSWGDNSKSLFVRDGELVYAVGGVGEIRSERRVDDGAWHTIALTSEANGESRFWIDGDPVVRGDGTAERKKREKRRAVKPRPGPRGVRILRGQAYAGTDHDRQKLDLLLPTRPASERLPLIVFIHGGAWRHGDRRSGHKALVPFVRSGKYVGATLSYRLTPEASWPAQIHDVKAGIRWLRANADKYGIDPNRVGVWGTSAGGHLASFLAVTNGEEELEGTLGEHLDVSSDVLCGVSYFGPTDLPGMIGPPSDIDHGAADSPEGMLIGGRIEEKTALARNASPISWIDKTDAPVMHVHGTEDNLVPFDQGVRFIERMKAAGAPHVFVRIEDGRHGNFGSLELDIRLALFFAKHLHRESVDIPSTSLRAHDGPRPEPPESDDREELDFIVATIRPTAPVEDQRVRIAYSRKGFPMETEFTGQIRKLAFHRKVLDPDILFESEFTEDGIVAYWEFDRSRDVFVDEVEGRKARVRVDPGE